MCEVSSEESSPQTSQRPCYQHHRGVFRVSQSQEVRAECETSPLGPSFLECAECTVQPLLFMQIAWFLGSVPAPEASVMSVNAAPSILRYFDLEGVVYWQSLMWWLL
jgi:hypothetical protein